MHRYLSAALLLFLTASAGWARQAHQPEAPAAAEPGAAHSGPKRSDGAQQPEAPAAAEPGAEAKAPDKALAYYHYSLAHLYEEMAVAYSRQDYFSKAIDHYKLAMRHDPNSAFLNSELADLYRRTGRLRDAVTEAEEILKRDPSNLDARRLLGRIYYHVLGDPPGGRVQPEMLRRAIEQYEKIVSQDPADLESQILLARLYRFNNDLTKAEAVLKKALERQPDNEETLTELASLYADTSQFNAAIELLQKVTAKSPNARMFAALGSAYEQARNHEEAVRAFRKALELDKDNPEYLRLLGQNLLYSEQFEEALAPYQTLLAANPQDGAAHLRLGQIYRQQRKFGLAEDHLKKAEALMTDSLEAPYNLALLAESQGRGQEAISIVKKLLERTAKPNPLQYSPRDRTNRAIFLERLGLLERSQGNYAGAEEAFRAMMDADEENAVRGVAQVVETLRQARQLDRALAEVETAVQRHPDDRMLKQLRATVLAENGRVDDGAASLRALLQNKPEDREILLALAQVYERAKRYPEAEQAVAAALPLAERNEEKEFVYFLWGSIFERQKKYDPAEEQFKKVLAINPNSAMALNYLGYMLADRGVRLDEAQKYIQTAVDHDPHNGAYLDSLGWVYFRMNRLDLAEQYLLKAAERVAKDGTIYDHLGDVYYQMGRIREAADMWQKALALWERTPSPDVDATEVARVQKKLESARVRLAQGTGK